MDGLRMNVLALRDSPDTEIVGQVTPRAVDTFLYMFLISK